MTPGLGADADDTRAGARIDLHCHTRASFDGVADAAALVARAAAIGLPTWRSRTTTRSTAPSVPGTPRRRGSG